MLRIVFLLALIALGADAAIAQTPKQIEDARVAADVCYDQLIAMNSSTTIPTAAEMRPITAKMNECKRLNARHLALSTGIQVAPQPSATATTPPVPPTQKAQVLNYNACVIVSAKPQITNAGAPSCVATIQNGCAKPVWCHIEFSGMSANNRSLSYSQEIHLKPGQTGERGATNMMNCGNVESTCRAWAQ